MSKQWATLVVHKYRGGRGIILNTSHRHLFKRGEVYYNHRLRSYPDSTKLNVVVRLSDTGKRMVQEIVVK